MFLIQVITVILVAGVTKFEASAVVLIGPNTHDESAFKLVDIDGNGKQFTVTPTSGSNNLIIRTDSRPDWNSHDAEQIRENNLIMFPYIDVSNGAKMILLRLYYNHESACEDYGSRVVQCHNHITLLVYSATPNDAARDLMSQHPIVEKNLSAVAGSLDKELLEFIRIPLQTQGIRIILWDQGSAYSVKNFFVRKFMCEWRNLAGAIKASCPDADATIYQNITVKCKCDDHSHPSDDSSDLHQTCVFDKNLENSYFLPNGPTCQCDSGYEKPPNKDYCQVLPTMPPSTWKPTTSEIAVTQTTNKLVTQPPSSPVAVSGPTDASSTPAPGSPTPPLASSTLSPATHVTEKETTSKITAISTNGNLLKNVTSPNDHEKSPADESGGRILSPYIYLIAILVFTGYL